MDNYSQPMRRDGGEPHHHDTSHTHSSTTDQSGSHPFRGIRNTTGCTKEGVHFAIKVTRQTRHPNSGLDRQFVETICICPAETKTAFEKKKTLWSWGLPWDESFRLNRCWFWRNSVFQDTHRNHPSSHHHVEVIRDDGQQQNRAVAMVMANVKGF